MADLSIRAIAALATLALMLGLYFAGTTVTRKTYPVPIEEKPLQLVPVLCSNQKPPPCPF